MTIFKTTQEIIDSSWKKNDNLYKFTDLPRQNEWLGNHQPKIKDIELWEQIYREPGNTAIYAAWSPFYEFYIICNEVFVYQISTWEQFVGESASVKVLERAKILEIDLEVSPVWIHYWNLDKIESL